MRQSVENMKYRMDVQEMRDLGAVKVIFFQGPAQGSLESAKLNY